MGRNLENFKKWREEKLKPPFTTRAINRRNGETGVSFSKQTNKWIAYICQEKKQIHLGCYDTKEEALIARNRFLIGDSLDA
jgi:hypothetical protein